jgi:hypothetical protein
MSQEPIYLFTDFGLQDPYVGQMRARLFADAPTAAVIDLHHHAPAYRPGIAGMLLANLVAQLPPGGCVIGVVDPGVGTQRGELAVHSGDRWLVGPDNGLFSAALANPGAEAYRLRLPCNPQESVSFHGRDRFAPAGAALVKGDFTVLGERAEEPIRDRPPREQVIYRDHYGNLMTGIAGQEAPTGSPRLLLGGHAIPRGRTFGEQDPGALFWYINSQGLVEVAAREASAADKLGLGPGAGAHWQS